MMLNKSYKIHLFPLLIFTFLWTYAYFGVLTRSHILLQAVILIILTTILLFLFYSYEKYSSINNDVDILLIKIDDIKIILLILFTVILVGFNYLTIPLVNDELSHSGSSHSYSIYALNILSDKLPSFIAEQRLMVLIWLISFLMLFSLVALLYLIQKISFKYKDIILSILILFIFRVILILLGGADPSHPPFRLFPLWLSSTILSPSIFAFRLPGIIALSLIGFIVYKTLKPKVNSFLVLWLSVFTLLTIPLLWHTSYLVEPSIWAALFAILFLLTFQAEKFNRFSYFTWFLLLSVFILMRQSLVFLILPMLFLFIIERRTKLFKVTIYFSVLNILIIL